MEVFMTNPFWKRTVKGDDLYCALSICPLDCGWVPITKIADGKNMRARYIQFTTGEE
jgi:hypothetical protein